MNMDLLREITMIITTIIVVIIALDIPDIKPVKKWFNIYFTIMLAYNLLSLIKLISDK